MTGNEANIECAAAAGLTLGTTPTTYNPGGIVSRAQMATFVARLIDTANDLDLPGAPDLTDLPAYDGTNEFDDNPDPAHVGAINRLADAGIVLGGPGGLPTTSYGGGLPVQRDQMASFINRAQEFLAGAGFSSTENFFTDDDTSVHEDNIQGIASVGIAIGDGIDTFNPGAGVNRDQMASFLVRHLAVNHAAGVIAAVPAPGTGATGPVTFVNIAGDTYTFTNGSASEVVTYDATNDVFTVDGNPASIGAFEAALSVGDEITFTDDAATTGAADADSHALTNVAQASIDSGMVGNVFVTPTTFAIIDPVSGVALSDVKDYTPGVYTVDGTAVAQVAFEAAINEGDGIEITGTAPSETFALTNATTTGSVSATTPVTNLVRVENLGDDPLTAQDLDYDYTLNSTFTVDGTVATVTVFETNLSVNDTLAVARDVGAQTFALTNVAPPTQTGVASDVFNFATDTFTAVDGADDIPFVYTGAALTVDGATVTVTEFETAYSPGDALSFRADDTATVPNEGRVDLTDADLDGVITAIDTTANTYSVANTEDNIIEAALLYVAANQRYFVNNVEETLVDFELYLVEVDADPSPDDTITVVPTGLATEHRLTTDKVIP